MGRRRRRSLCRLDHELRRSHPALADPETAIAQGRVTVDGCVLTNPRSLVRQGAAIALLQEVPLRGEAKLRAALAAFALDAGGRVAVDVGAAAGGFTRVLLAAGAARVYAVDAGHGQLLGSLRQHPRVVVLESTNLGELDATAVPEQVDLITLDLSYLALAVAVPQLERLALAPRTEAIALVKPQFELGLAAPPEQPAQLAEAVARAGAGFATAGWDVLAAIESPVRGRRGAVEFLLHARRRS